jgi:hypothetical protein
MERVVGDFAVGAAVINDDDYNGAVDRLVDADDRPMPDTIAEEEFEAEEAITVSYRIYTPLERLTLDSIDEGGPGCIAGARSFVPAPCSTLYIPGGDPSTIVKPLVNSTSLPDVNPEVDPEVDPGRAPNLPNPEIR